MAISDQARLRPAQQVGALKSLDGAASTGLGTAFSLGGPYRHISVQLVATGGTTDATVQLQGALASSAEANSTAVWQQVGSNITYSDTGNGAITLVGSTVPINHVRLNVSALTTASSTGTDSLSGWISASR